MSGTIVAKYIWQDLYIESQGKSTNKNPTQVRIEQNLRILQCFNHLLCRLPWPWDRQINHVFLMHWKIFCNGKGLTLWSCILLSCSYRNLGIQKKIDLVSKEKWLSCWNARNAQEPLKWKKKKKRSCRCLQNVIWRQYANAGKTRLKLCNIISP